jgi:cytochrome P450
VDGRSYGKKLDRTWRLSYTAVVASRAGTRDPAAVQWTEADLLDPYPLYRRLRDAAPVSWDDDQEAWLVTGFTEALTAFRDDEALRAHIERQAMVTRWPEVQDQAAKIRRHFDAWPLFTDGEEHERRRRLIQRLYSPAAVTPIHARVRAEAERLLDAAAAVGHLDAVSGYARPLARAALAEFLHVDVAELHAADEWSHQLLMYMNVNPSPETIRRVEPAIAAVRAFALELCERPGLPRDSLGAVLGGALRDGLLAEDDIAAIVAQNVTGALGAIPQLIVHAIDALLREPGQLARLRRRPDLARPTVEEALRVECPFLLSVRQASCPLVLGETEIPPGDAVALMIGAANRDPRRFVDPDSFEIERADGNHLAFGIGSHFCLGAAMTRDVTEAALSALVSRFEAIRRAGRVERLGLLGMRCITSLPLDLV